MAAITCSHSLASMCAQVGCVGVVSAFQPGFLQQSSGLRPSQAAASRRHAVVMNAAGKKKVGHHASCTSESAHHGLFAATFGAPTGRPRWVWKVL